MHTQNRLFIRADARSVYDLAANVDRWPSLLPHYRYVRTIDSKPDRRILAMGARRDWIPVSWRAEQRLFPDEPRITFRHVGGVTRGMEVEWSFDPQDHGVHVVIQHDLTMHPTWLSPLLADRFIGPHFVHAIAGRTLACFKALLERETDARPVIV